MVRGGAGIVQPSSSKSRSSNVSGILFATTIHNYANDEQYKLYQFVDMHGGGELIKWMRYARKGGDYSIVDGYIEAIPIKSLKHTTTVWI